MGITLSDRERRFIALVEEESGATVRDCVVEDDGRLLFVVAPDDMAAAVGPDGRTVRRLEERLDREIRLVADAERAEDFVANALAPAAVYGVTIEDEEGRTDAAADVDPDDRGIAIGADGRNVDAARTAGAVTGALDDVPTGEREMLRLVADGRTPGEAAAELGISPGAGWTRLSRARRRLRTLVNELGTTTHGPAKGEN
jgi:N utilization substance protein A